MNKINLALTSDGEDKGSAQVHLNATFESREAAIEFHAQVAALCRSAARVHGGVVSGTASGFFPWRFGLVR